MEKLVLAGQSILTLIADLKRDALLSDFAAMNELVHSQREKHKAILQQCNRQIQALEASKFERVSQNQ